MNIRDKYIFARWLYSIGQEAEVTNADYTILHNYMKKTYPDDEYVNRSWSSDPCPVDLLKSLGREDLIYEVVLSDKTESIESIGDFTTFNNLYKDIKRDGTVSIKEDGWNAQANYYNGVLTTIHTRGRTKDALDVSWLKNVIPNTIPMMGLVKIPGELTIPNDKFAEISDTYDTEYQRQSVSTAIARKRFDCLAFHAHDILTAGKNFSEPFSTLRGWGFETPLFLPFSNWETLYENCMILNEIHASYGYPSDGLVVRDDVLIRALRLWTWEEPIKRSYVTGYYLDSSAHNITIGAKIFPIKMPMSMQRQVTCTNLDRVIRNNLQIGAPIAFKYTSGSIGILDEVATEVLHEEFKGQWEIYRTLVESENG